MIVRELVTKLSFRADNSAVKRFDQNIGRLKNSLGGVTTNLKQTANGIRNLGAGLTAFVSLPLGLLAGGMIKAASDAEETEAKFGTVFSSIRSEADAVADNLKKNFGLSSNASKQLLSDTGDLLSGFGFAQDETLKFSKDVNELAVDLASFTNLEGGAERASRSLTKALLGERESIKELGIAILEKDVVERVALNRSKGITRATMRQEKALATLQLAQEQSKNAIGDFARTSEGFANQMRIFKARLNDLSVEFGKILLPVALKVVRALGKVVAKFSGLSKSAKTTILIIGGIVAALGPLLLVFGVLASAVISLISLFSVFGVWLLPIIAVVAAISAAVGLLIEDFIVWTMGGKSLIGTLIGSFEDFKAKVMPVLSLLKDTFVNFWKGIVKGDQEALAAFTKNIEELVPVLIKVTTKLLGVMLKVAKELGKLFFGILERLISSIGGAIARMIASAFSKLIKSTNNLLDGVVDGLIEKYPVLGKFLVGSGKKRPPKAPETGGNSSGGGFFDSLKNIGSSFKGTASSQSTSANFARAFSVGGKPGISQQNQFHTELTVQLTPGTTNEQAEELLGIIRDENAQNIESAINSSPVTE